MQIRKPQTVYFSISNFWYKLTQPAWVCTHKFSLGKRLSHKWKQISQLHFTQNELNTKFSAFLIRLTPKWFLTQILAGYFVTLLLQRRLKNCWKCNTCTVQYLQKSWEINDITYACFVLLTTSKNSGMRIDFGLYIIFNNYFLSGLVFHH